MLCKRIAECRIKIQEVNKKTTEGRMKAKKKTNRE